MGAITRSNPQNVVNIGQRIGTVYEAEDCDALARDFIHIRISLDVIKPLCHTCWAKSPDGEKC